jgi:hypothetical protein
MSRFDPVRGLAALVAVICVGGCEAAKSANPVAPSSTVGVGVAATSEPPAVSTPSTPARIDAPRAMAPAGRLSTNNPDFFVANGAIEGGSGVAYRFEVSRTAGFTELVAVVTVPVSETGTTMMSLGSMAYGGTYYWRAKGSDGGVESDFSNTLSFTLPSGPDAGWSGDPVASIPSAHWSTDQWRTYFFELAAQKGGATVTNEGMHAMRADLVARGADFQNGWRGDLRPRLFLPVPGCPIANRPDVPSCSYSRTVDLGGHGQEWRWWVR